jgi:hypothetical protein
MALFPKEYKVADSLPRKTLRIYNLPPTTNDILASIFDDYGRVFECKQLMSENRELRDVALVTLDAIGAKRAMSLNNGYILGNQVTMKIEQDSIRKRWVAREYVQKGIPGTKKEWKVQAEAFDKLREKRKK